jgi:hypothetical protein
MNRVFAVLVPLAVVACTPIDPGDPDRLSQVITIPGAVRVQGQPPSQASSSAGPGPTIAGGDGLSVTSGGQAVLNVQYQASSGYRGCFVQVRGASDYFRVESNEAANEGRIQIPINIPDNVDTGSFEMYTCIQDANGGVSNPLTTSIAVTNPNPSGSTCSNQFVCAAANMRNSTRPGGCCSVDDSCPASCSNACGEGWYEVRGQVIGPCRSSDSSCFQSAAQTAVEACR